MSPSTASSPYGDTIMYASSPMEEITPTETNAVSSSGVEDANMTGTEDVNDEVVDHTNNMEPKGAAVKRKREDSPPPVNIVQAENSMLPPRANPLDYMKPGVDEQHQTKKAKLHSQNPTPRALKVVTSAQNLSQPQRSPIAGPGFFAPKIFQGSENSGQSKESGGSVDRDSELEQDSESEHDLNAVREANLERELDEGCKSDSECKADSERNSDSEEESEQEQEPEEEENSEDEENSESEPESVLMYRPSSTSTTSSSYSTETRLIREAERNQPSPLIVRSTTLLNPFHKVSVNPIYQLNPLNLTLSPIFSRPPNRRLFTVQTHKPPRTHPTNFSDAVNYMAIGPDMDPTFLARFCPSVRHYNRSRLGQFAKAEPKIITWLNRPRFGAIPLSPSSPPSTSHGVYGIVHTISPSDLKILQSHFENGTVPRRQLKEFTVSIKTKGQNGLQDAGQENVWVPIAKDRSLNVGPSEVAKINSNVELCHFMNKGIMAGYRGGMPLEYGKILDEWFPRPQYSKKRRTEEWTTNWTVW